ncbi:MAG: SRPBCC family protein [Acidimicrobiales bacterium]
MNLRRGHRPGFAHSESVLVDAPADRVFAQVADLRAHPRLAGSGEVRAIRVPDSEPLRVGTRFEADEVIRIGPFQRNLTARSEVVEHEPPAVLSWTSRPTSGPKPKRIQWWFRLSRVGPNRTRVVHDVEVDFGFGLNALVGVPYRLARRRSARRGMAQTLKHLAHAATTTERMAVDASSDAIGVATGGRDGRPAPRPPLGGTPSHRSTVNT